MTILHGKLRCVLVFKINQKLSKSQCCQVQYESQKLQFFDKGTMCDKTALSWSTVVLQRRPGIQKFFSSVKKTCLFGSNKCHIIGILIVFFSGIRKWCRNMFFFLYRFVCPTKTQRLFLLDIVVWNHLHKELKRQLTQKSANVKESRFMGRKQLQLCWGLLVTEQRRRNIGYGFNLFIDTINRH